MRENAAESRWSRISFAIHEYLSSLHYSYGLRLVVGVALAWFIAFRLQTDKPYWSIMTVIIVTLPTQAKLVEKFLARLIGTIVGAISVNIIASVALDDQWLFAIYMGFWLALCSYLASARSSMLTYCFALCGYTSAILGFSLSISPSSYMVFQISQARILEILIGLVTAFFISMLWPAYLERVELKRKLREKRSEVRELYRSLLTPGFDKNRLYQQYHTLLNGLIDFRDLVFQDFLSVSTDTEENKNVYRYGHRLIKAMSGVLLLESMKRDLLQTMPEVTERYLLEQREWFLSVQPREEKLANKPAAPVELMRNSKGRNFVEKMDKKLLMLFSTRVEDDRNADLYIPSIRIYYSDRKEALINAIRTFVSVMAGMAFWMGTQWETGYILMVLIGVVCTIGATYPMINKLLTVGLALSMFITIPVVFLVKYGVLIKINHIVPAMMIILPIYFVAALIKVRSLLGFLIGYGFMLSSVFLIGFSNPMTYEFGNFANAGLTMIIAFVIILIIFNIIRPSSDDVKLERVKLRVLEQFGARVRLTRGLSYKELRDFEAYLFSAIYKVRTISESRGKAEMLAYSFLTLAILRMQREYAKNDEPWHFPEEICAAIETGDLAKALALTKHERTTASTELKERSFWELESALNALIDFLTSSETEELSLSVPPAVPGT